MHPSFNIRSDNSNAAQLQLFVQTGRQSISLITLDAADKKFCDLVVYHFDQRLASTELAEQVKEIFEQEQLLEKQYTKTDVIYAFNESILTPHEVFNSVSNEEMLDVVFGDAFVQVIKSDFMYRNNLHNIYRIPTEIDSVMTQQFSSANFTHQYSLLPTALKASELAAVFYPNTMIVFLCSNNKLQLIQSFDYSIPEDAAYHLLSVCKNFDVQLSQVNLSLYGMIDQDSPLFTTLYKYFMNISFAKLPEDFIYTEEIKNFPGHYFSHLFSIASCV